MRDRAAEARGMSLQSLMKSIMENGAPVKVCGIHLLNKDIGSEALIDGLRPPCHLKWLRIR